MQEHLIMSTSQPLTHWTIDRLGDLAGKRYLITGGNSGVGYEAAAHLRRANADVFIGCRSTTKGAAAAATLGRIPSVGGVELIELDLASMESIHRANDAIRAHTDGLDGVVNNAGIMQTPQQQT
ncbi:MAG: SDR family NAD(P)-dependent oxidoreductase, partial [Acidimicrobiia bacterium]|nr:SDR family NAD(P)-dependent oxidoreductase [Acidimicrobiia bacterium]